MSDAGDDIQVDAPAEVEVSTEAPKGKLSVEDALQVSNPRLRCWLLGLIILIPAASSEERSRS